jgi:hypothetical protein
MFRSINARYCADWRSIRSRGGAVAPDAIAFSQLKRTVR